MVASPEIAVLLAWPLSENKSTIAKHPPTMKLLLSLLPLLTLVSAEQLRFNPTDTITSFSSSKVLTHKANARLADLKGQSDDFTILEHEDYPGHSVRIKETTGMCDPDVASFTGYLDVGNQKNLFFCRCILAFF